MKKFISMLGGFARRFPAQSFISLAGVVLAWRLAFLSGRSEDTTLSAVTAMFAAFAFSSLVQVSVERLGKGCQARLASAAACVALFLLLSWAMVCTTPLKRESFWIRYLLAVGAVLSFFAFAISKKEDEGRNLPFLVGPALLGVGVGLVVAGTISLAMFALDSLFGIHFDRAYLFMLLTGLFSIAPVAFLLFALQKTSPSPEKTSRVLLDFILCPIFLVNLAILFAYFAKCVLLASLPKGEITLLVSSACAIWLLLCLLLSYSSTRFSQFFRLRVAWAVFPLLGLQLLAIAIRIRQHGLTPIRYLAVALTIFYAVAAILATVRRGRHVRHLYVIFGAMALFAAFAPILNAIDASVMAQKARIRAVFRACGVQYREETLKGNALKNEPAFDDAARRKIRAAQAFADGFRRRYGYYIGNGPLYYYEGATTGERRHYARRVEACGLLRENVSFDVSGYSRMRPVSFPNGQCAWNSPSVPICATESEIAAAATNRPTLTINLSETQDDTIEVDCTKFFAHVAVNASLEGDGALSLFPLDERRDLLFISGHIYYHRIDQDAPDSVTNIVPALLSSTSNRPWGLLFERGE